ncbi:sugar phosphate isomerase/epimerase family protein [Fibrella aquatilis]|uniref:Sugar phosphate isomerase/epimerase n=1 Tax=Fibrella aquatilis TaxID=2817059 RepID=A0A939JYS2_9BACT|nr:sugar phosphate isomerase/epimerase [Fibrella aquatilis]MBO0929440.1 sugar phosphate isomerase/epimerase [Fibrella aquatilis]
MPTSRRQFLASIAATSAVATLPTTKLLADKIKPQPTGNQLISCNSYTWLTFYGREKKQWMADPDASLKAFASSGFTAYEPGVSSLKDVQGLSPLLKKYALAMPSLYVNSLLHIREKADASIATALAIADAAKPLGTRIIVTNPDPIKWGSPENKSDDQLAEQLRNLDRLGAELQKRGMTLAYHTHAPEHRAAAREFHHMMVGSNPNHVKLCLDAHWVYRGSENSQIALFDVVKLYGPRIAEIHVRQSQNGIWSETFTPTGDIDYPRLLAAVRAAKANPQIVMEQCLETGSPNTLDAVAAHRQDLTVAKTVFGQ